MLTPRLRIIAMYVGAAAAVVAAGLLARTTRPVASRARAAISHVDQVLVIAAIVHWQDQLDAASRARAHPHDA